MLTASRSGYNTIETTDARRRRGAGLIVGGIVLALLVAPIGPLKFYWLPLVSGLTYLLAAAASGPRGALWAPGLVITGFGVAIVLDSTTFSGIELPLVLLGLGAGAVLAALAHRAGVVVSGLSIGLSILLTGAFVLAVYKLSWIDKAWWFGILLGGWGLWELRPARR